MTRKRDARKWAGSKDLEPLLVEVSGLTQDPDNARRHGARNLDAIKASLEEFGQQKPIVVVAGTGEVLAGNGTLSVAVEQLGWTHIAVVKWHGSATDGRKFAVADNRAPEHAWWDRDGLTKLLREFSAEEGFDPSTIGFSADEVNGLIRSATETAERATEAVLRAAETPAAPSPSAHGPEGAGAAPAPLDTGAPLPGGSWPAGASGSPSSGAPAPLPAEPAPRDPGAPDAFPSVSEESVRSKLEHSCPRCGYEW